MTELSSKQVKRAIIEFEEKTMALLRSSLATYKARVRDLITLIESDQVINSIIKPIMESVVNFEEIEIGNGFWIKELRLPITLDGQIAYVLQVLNRGINGKLSLENYAHRIYKHKRIDENLNDFNHEIVEPALKGLLRKLKELVEDEVENKETLEASNLQIFNVSQLTASAGSNIAIGTNITQSASNEINYAEKIIQKALDKEIINQENAIHVKMIAEELQEELDKSAPSESKLKEFAKRVYEIGKNALLSITKDVITDPRWGQAIAGFLLAL